MLQLSEHFTLEELTHSQLAERLGIRNEPANDVLPHLAALAQGLEQVRRVLGHPLIVHSGLRVEDLERELCVKDFAAWCALHGKEQATAWPEYFARKAHPKGYAADFICPAFGTPAEIVKVLEASGIKFDKLICEGTWVHISFDPQMRGEVLAATFTDGVPSYAPA